MVEKVKSVKLLVAQSCLTLCDPTHKGSSVHGILQQEYWSGLPFPSPGHLPESGIEPGSPALQVDSSPSEPPGKIWLSLLLLWILLFKEILFILFYVIHLFLAVLGLRCCASAFFVASGGCFSLQFEGFSLRSRLSLGSMGSRARRLQ